MFTIESTPPVVTLRDYFAAAALQGLLSQHMTEETESGHRDFEPVYFSAEKRALACERAYEIADAMIAARNKKEKP